MLCLSGFELYSRWVPLNQTYRFLMVSFLILLRSLRVNILKQLFTSGSVNIVEYSTILTSPSANKCSIIYI